MFRAYAISEGDFRTRSFGGVAAQPLPASIPAFASELLGARAGDDEATITLEEIRRSGRYRFQSNERILMIVPDGKPEPIAYTAGSYTPFLYAPSALLLFLARMSDLSLLAAFYLIRLAHLALSVAAGYAAIRIAPFGRNILAMIGLLPMTVFLRSSLSPDSILIGLAMLAFAVMLRLAASGEVSPRLIAMLLGLTFLIAVTKPFYLLMPALALTVPFRHLRSRIRAFALVGSAIATIALAVVVVAIWTSAPPSVAGSAGLPHSEAKHIGGPGPAGDVDEQAQLMNLSRAPGRLVLLTARDFTSKLGFYSSMFAGRFGWLDTPLPPTVRTFVLVVLILIALMDGAGDRWLSSGQRVVLLLVFIGTLLAIAGSQYVMWTPVNAELIEGIQGRYFIPVAPALLLVLANRRLSATLAPATRARLVAFVMLLALAVATWAMTARFYGIISPPV